MKTWMNAPPATVRMNSRSMMLVVHLQPMKRVAGTTTTTASTIQIATTVIRMMVWSTAPGTLCQERWRRSRLWPAAMFSDHFPLEAPGRIVSPMTTILAARHHHHLLLPRMKWRATMTMTTNLNERVELRKKIPERMKIAAVAAAQIRKVVIMNQVLRVLVMAPFGRQRASMKTRMKMKIQISR